MTSSIADMPDFREAIETHELVYLFGTGISSALTGRRYGWYTWIEDGLRLMKDRECAAELLHSLHDDSSAENLIRVVGDVLTHTTHDGMYHTWMQDSFEQDAITRPALARTLQKLHLSHSVFATTNYDLYLEAATGLGSLTYEQPDEAFSMLDRRDYHSVLHIHGMYDSANGTDNIVADAAQYAAVLGDKGAQFIQHILGTRTLIFVGCGQTAEDANIASFIRFAHEHLKMERTYYFLCKKGEQPSGLPGNVVTIPYGDHYDDLPDFLEHMAQRRLTALMERTPLIGRTAYGKQEKATSSLAKYHYSRENIPFCGREKELQCLMELLQERAETTRWWAVTGQAGAGKSRLAMEWLHRLPAGWFGFFLADNFTDADIRAFTPFAHTVVVVDYVAGRESIVAQAMQKLDERFQDTGYRLNILLLERENSRNAGSWYAKLSKAFSRFRSMENSVHHETLLCLDDMDTEAVDALIGEVCTQHHLPADAQRNQHLRERYAEKFEMLRFRPLYVQLFVEAWIDNGFTVPQYDSCEDLLAEVLKREQQRWLTLFENNQPCCNAMIRLMMRAGISGTLAVSELPCYYQQDWAMVRQFIDAHTFPGVQRNEETLSLLGDVCQNMNSTHVVICPMFPDLLKEYMFFYYRHEEHLPEVMRELWAHAAHDCAVFLHRCLTDFPENAFYFRALNSCSFSKDDITLLLGRMEMLKKNDITENDNPIVLLRIISNEHEFWKTLAVPQQADEKESDEISILKITGLQKVATQMAGWTLHDLSPAMDAIDDMLAVPCGEAGVITKKIFLESFINTFSAQGFAEEAKELMQKQNALHTDVHELSALSSLSSLNADMMNNLLDGDIQTAAGVLETMYAQCHKNTLIEAQALAFSCRNMAYWASQMGEVAYLDKGLAIAEELATLHPDDVKVETRTMMARACKLEYSYFEERAIRKADVLQALDAMDAHLQTLLPAREENDSDAYAEAWEMVKTLRLNFIEKDEQALRGLIQDCETLLAHNPHQPSIAKTQLHALEALYQNVLHRKISKRAIEDAFRYVEQNPDSETLRELFFELLPKSEEAKNRKTYMPKSIISHAINAISNPVSDGGVPEIAQLIGIPAPGISQPYTRPHPKVGANAPCPCGSGKKFKRCCQGNGRFD